MMGNAAKQNIAYFKQNLICDKIARNVYLIKAAEHDVSVRTPFTFTQNP